MVLLLSVLDGQPGRAEGAKYQRGSIVRRASAKCWFLECFSRSLAWSAFSFSVELALSKVHAFGIVWGPVNLGIVALHLSFEPALDKLTSA